MAERNIIVSAPGKVILHGEHAVVYGKSAIAASVDLRSYIHLTRTDSGDVCVELPAINLKQRWTVKQLQEIAKLNKVDIASPSPPDEEVIKTITENACQNLQSSHTKLQSCVAFLYLYTAICGKRSTLPSIWMKIVSNLPVGAGLGSSASFSVCLSAALLLEQGFVSAPVKCENGLKQWKDEDLDLVNKWAYQGERIMHGNPSGIDNSVATFGGAIKLYGGKITKLNKIPRLRILLTCTNVPRSTKTLVSSVRERYNRLPDVMQPIMDATEAVAEQCLSVLETMATDSQNDPENGFTVLEELIDINQHLLQAMGVSHETLDKICHVTSKYKLHSKLTGAGGGGCAFTLLRPSVMKRDVDNVVGELDKEGFNCLETEVGSYGVMVHSNMPEDLSRE